MKTVLTIEHEGGSWEEALRLLRQKGYKVDIQPEAAFSGKVLQALGTAGDFSETGSAGSFFSDHDGKEHSCAIVSDPDECAKVREALNLAKRQLSFINRIADIFLTVPDDAMYGEVLTVILEVMESRYGFFGFINDRGDLVLPTLTSAVWDDCRMHDKSIVFPRESWSGLWGRALSEKKAFFANGGFKVPDGHVQIENFLAVPVLSRDELIGLVGVANGEGGYDERHREILESIVCRIAPILDARIQRDKKEKEKKEAEDALRRSESRLRSVFTAIPDLVSIIDKDFRIILSNWGGGYGYVPEEVRKSKPYCFEAYYGMSERCEPCHVVQVMKTGRLVSREKYNSRVGYVEIHSAPVLDESGNIDLVVEIVRDITERKIAEEALAKEKEQLSVTLRSIGDGVITTDTEGRIVLLNRIAEELTGWCQDEAVGKPFDEVFVIVNEKTGQPCDNPVKRILEHGDHMELEPFTQLVSRDGKKRTIADSGAPIRDRENGVVGAVLVFRDVTDKKRMEEELLRVRQLESIGVLAGGIAHDFNNLLTAILGNISLAKTIASGDEKIKHKLLEAEKASLRARDLTQQLLTFSRGGAPVKQTAGISDIIRESASFSLSGSRTLCCYEIREDLWPVEVDVGQISQVINNLIINADQAMPNGGAIEVACRNVLVGRRDLLPLRDGRYIMITIRDHGVGIPPEYLGRIFDPYYTTKKSGKGLGLATVYSIVKNHDGYIEVKSKLGEGSIFTIYLPCANGAALEPKAEQSPVAAMVTPAVCGRILVMDDEENVRYIAGEMLNFLGYEVEFARDGEEAVKLYRKALDAEDPFAAVIMDLTVPGGMGGKETMELLGKMDEKVRGIASSGYSNDPVMADHRCYGFRGIIRKPYELEDMRRALEEVIGEG